MRRSKDTCSGPGREKTGVRAHTRLPLPLVLLPEVEHPVEGVVERLSSLDGRNGAQPFQRAPLQLHGRYAAVSQRAHRGIPTPTGVYKWDTTVDNVKMRLAGDPRPRWFGMGSKIPLPGERRGLLLSSGRLGLVALLFVALLVALALVELGSLPAEGQTAQAVEITFNAMPAGCGVIYVNGAQISVPSTLSFTPMTEQIITAYSTVCRFKGWQAGSMLPTTAANTLFIVPPYSESVTAVYQAPPPRVVQVLVTSSPTSSGIIQVDGNYIDTPQGFYWLAGSTHYLTAQYNVPCISSDCQGIFLYWESLSIGTVSSPSITYIVPYMQETVTAVYELVATASTNATTSSAFRTTITVSSSAMTQTVAPDFALTISPSTVVLPPGTFQGTASFTMTLTSLEGWLGLVRFSTTPLPAGLTLSNMPTSYSLSQQASWLVAVNFAGSTPPGDYMLTITATSGPLSQTAAVTIEVATPNPVPEFPQSLVGLVAACVVLASIAVNRRRKTSPAT